MSNENSPHVAKKSQNIAADNQFDFPFFCVNTCLQLIVVVLLLSHRWQYWYAE